MCCCGDIDESRTKVKHTEASWSVALVYALFGLFVFAPYIILSIIWYIECNELEADDTDGAQFLCGSWAMWLCVGWVPVGIYIFIAIITTRYILRQSKSAMKVLNSQRAWLITFAVVLMTVLFVIHTAYVGYLLVELYNNNGCKSRAEASSLIQNHHNCDALDVIIMLLFVWCIIIIIYVCASLSMLFALVNGRIATPVEYETARRLETERITPGEAKKLSKIGHLASTTNLPEDNEDTESEDSNNSDYVDSEGNPRVRDVALPRTEQQKRVTKLKVNDRVFVRVSARTNEGCPGTIMYWGPVPGYNTEYTTMFAGFFFGVRLDEPIGNVDGTFKGKRYFDCTPGYGVFVAPPDVRRLRPEEDPMSNMQSDRAGMPTSTLALTIARNDNPNHLFNGHLFGFLRQNVRMTGLMTYVTIGTVDFYHHMARTDALLESIIPVSGHSRRRYNKFDKRRASMANTHNSLHQFLPTLRRNTKYQYFYDSNMVDKNYDSKYNSDDSETSLHDSDDEKHTHMETGQPQGLPKVHLWYLQLHASWNARSNEIVAHGQFDYQSSRWVTKCQQTAKKWYNLLGLNWKSQFSSHFTKGGDELETAIRFGAAPVPKFVRKKSKHRENRKNPRFSDEAPHYLALGIFQSHYDKEQQKFSQVGTLETKPQQLQRGRQVEFTLKRLIHESVSSLEDLIPYYKCNLYNTDNEEDSESGNNRNHLHNRRKYGWFPIDWCYAEVDFEDELNNEFETLFDSYHFPSTHAHYNASPWIDDGDSNEYKYNPYWMMRYPRVPLFTVEMKLPLDAVERLVSEIDEKTGEELYNTRQTRLSVHYEPNAQHPQPNMMHNMQNMHNMGNLQNNLRPHAQQGQYAQQGPYGPHGAAGAGLHMHPQYSNTQYNTTTNQSTPYSATTTTQQQQQFPRKHDSYAHQQYYNHDSRESSQDYRNANAGNVVKPRAANIRFRNNQDDNNMNNMNNGQNSNNLSYPRNSGFDIRSPETDGVELDDATTEQLSNYYSNANSNNNYNNSNRNRNNNRRNNNENDGIDVVYDNRNHNHYDGRGHGHHGQHGQHGQHGHHGQSGDTDIIYSD